MAAHARAPACAAVADFLAEHELLDASDRTALDALNRKLAADKLVLACVAEVSRGKSELLNAIFFADTGRRVLPATPGRTTMCPVELQYHAGQPAELALLPIDTRLGTQSLAELRTQPEAWQRLSLDPRNPDGLAEALNLVTQTRRVSTVTAASLGFWSDSHPQDNPPRLADGSVEVPAWRHALINYPHPLLERGLVVVDTPGLNAIGAEPELTLGLLPAAHAIIFLLAADTGVSRSDLSIWTDHLAGDALERFVVLNKIDTLVDPLSTPAALDAQLDAHRRKIAQTLEMPPARVFALSARDALAARVNGDAAALERSGLPALETALATELLPRQRELLSRASVLASAASAPWLPRGAWASGGATTPNRCSNCAVCAARVAPRCARWCSAWMWKWATSSAARRACRHCARCTSASCRRPWPRFRAMRCARK